LTKAPGSGGHEPASAFAAHSPNLSTAPTLNGLDRGRPGPLAAKWSFGDIPVNPLVQPKLAIGAVNDPLEAEADRTAAELTRDPDTAPPRSVPPVASRPQRAHPGAETAGLAPAAVDEVLTSPGRPLEPDSLAFFGRRFGYDFSQVRIHTGPEAEQSAQSIGALAYTAGPHVAFGASAYAPSTAPGRRLIAHELAHVVQQDARVSPVVSPRIQRSALDDHTNKAERDHLQVPTRETRSPLSADDLKKQFETKDKGTPPSDEIFFGAEIDAKLQPGLRNLAADLFSSQDSVLNAALDLTPFGGSNGVYRFAFVGASTGRKSRAIIERVSTKPPADPGAIDIAAEEKRLAKFEFTVGKGFGSDDDKKLLYLALKRQPENILNRLKGITFELNPSVTAQANESGHYDPNTHTIVFFSDAMLKSALSPDFGAASQFTYILAHEIGHAVDFEHSTARLQAKRDAIAKQWQKAVNESKKVKVDPNAPIGEDKPDPEAKKKEAEVTRLKAELDKADADLVQALNTPPTLPSDSPQFGAAKGEAISKTGAESASQDFAELFALYVLDPNLLKSLRPAAFKYFSDKYK
jgi:hypothetical protein